METRSIYKIYEESIGKIVPLMIEPLRIAEGEYKHEWIERAFGIAKDNNIRNWCYVEAILKRMKEEDDAIIMDHYRVSVEGRSRYGEWESEK